MNRPDLPSDPAPDPAMAFGCMQFGGSADAQASAALFDACRAVGISCFDTAHAYTGGESERLLGRLLRDAPGASVATKVGYSGGAGRANLTAQFDISRKRLGLEAVDLLYLHRFDPGTPLEESLETLVRFQADGLIRRIGVSNFAAWQVMKAQGIAARLGSRVDAIQPMYSLVKRQAEVELLPMAMDQGIVPYTYSPLAAGLLSGKYTGGGGTGRLTADGRYAARYAVPAMGQAARGLAALAAEAAVHSATLAVAWVMSHPARPVPIVSARDAGQLAPSLAALHFRMEAGLYARVAALYPAPPPATDRTEEAQ